MRSWDWLKNGQIARFIEPMECLPVANIPEGDLWTYELKLDGYRAIAVKSGGKAMIYSRRGSDLTRCFRYVAYVADALESLPDETVIDGEVVALDEQGRPSFNLLQTTGPADDEMSKAPLVELQKLVAQAGGLASA